MSDQLGRGEQFTLEEAVVRFRTESVDEEDLTASVAAVRRALEPADRGEGNPPAEAMRQLREEFNLPTVAEERRTR